MELLWWSTLYIKSANPQATLMLVHERKKFGSFLWKQCYFETKKSFKPDFCNQPLYPILDINVPCIFKTMPPVIASYLSLLWDDLMIAWLELIYLHSAGENKSLTYLWFYTFLKNLHKYHSMIKRYFMYTTSS